MGTGVDDTVQATGLRQLLNGLDLTSADGRAGAGAMLREIAERAAQRPSVDPGVASDDSFGMTDR